MGREPSVALPGTPVTPSDARPAPGTRWSQQPSFLKSLHASVLSACSRDRAREHRVFQNVSSLPPSPRSRSRGGVRATSATSNPSDRAQQDLDHTQSDRDAVAQGRVHRLTPTQKTQQWPPAACPVSNGQRAAGSRRRDVK
ncbi:hypothetical protein D623_10005197 [Myotis brandtii]|uniref:Uncharacterized protein n=1 Tax=Myotis brandtii TaxID=109478 RepID=S7N7J4_MYOBR|nr:hypothetical protein D623_10005197 [Myotis brandtii]